MAEESAIQQQEPIQGQPRVNEQWQEPVQNVQQTAVPASTQAFVYDPAQAPTPEEVQALMHDAQPAMPADAPGLVQEFAQGTTPTPAQVEAPDPVQVQTIVVRTGRLVCDVQIPDARFRYTTPRLSAFANGQYPDLPHHACVNGVGDTFGYVMEKTSVAHLLEHLVISEQVRSQSSNAATFVGTTEWLDEEAGLARIEVGFKDDLVALRAFNEATRFLNIAVLTCLA